MVNRAPIAYGKGKKRVQLLKIHRLLEFEKVFSSYLEGGASASYVRQRAKKMLEIGLPRLK